MIDNMQTYQWHIICIFLIHHRSFMKICSLCIYKFPLTYYIYVESFRIFYRQLQFCLSSDETDPGEEEEGGGDSVDGGLGLRSRLKTKAYKMTIYWVSFLDQQQRVVLFTQDPRVAEAARMVRFKIINKD